MKEYSLTPSKLELEIRQSGSKRTARLVGYAATWDQPSEEFFGFREVVRRGAFTKTLQERDQVALWNHDPGEVLGRRSAGTLELKEDDTGLRVVIIPPDTQAGRDALEVIGRGDVTEMSFGFKPVGPDGDRWVRDPDLGELRELREVELFEVSPVAFPAYPSTEIAVREKTKAVELRRAAQGLTPLESGATVLELEQIEAAKAPKRRRLEELAKI